MPVELTRNGTRGVNLTRLPRPLLKVGLAAFSVVARMRGARLLTLTTYGTRSQREHSVSLRYFDDPQQAGAWLVVASFSGGAKHPAWYVNMARNPDRIRVTLDGRGVAARADSLAGEERAEMWDFIVARAPGYAAYQAKTDREIPIVRLTPLA
jgi:deazaflavin-dependent oxidoreductase (nitroreductase family)